MYTFTALITNYPLICTGSAWLVAQVLKVFTGIFRERRFSVLEFLFGNGGMPSSHSASVVALCVACAIKFGLGSPYFAISFLLCVIVMRDATGVRWETGEQAKVLNRIMQDLFKSDRPEEFNKNLKELVGHTPLQVFVGAIVGAAVPFALMAIPAFGIL
ncbi:MAG: divergent PAP2 family protein [Ruminococcaceae bacterium]|nr:divergent PAP2 family protein [Oscillospiraceae bacterium]